MLELNEVQVELLNAMAGDHPYQIIVKLPKHEEPEKAEKFSHLNKSVDQLIMSGFVTDVTAHIERPQGFNHEFRVVGLTILGKNLFSATQQEGVASA